MVDKVFMYVDIHINTASFFVLMIQSFQHLENIRHKNWTYEYLYLNVARLFSLIFIHIKHMLWYTLLWEAVPNEHRYGNGKMSALRVADISRRSYRTAKILPLSGTCQLVLNVAYGGNQHYTDHLYVCLVSGFRCTKEKPCLHDNQNEAMQSYWHTLV